jgi:hypothetical protein
MCSRNRCSFRNRPDQLSLINGLLERKYSAKKIEEMAGIAHSQVGRHAMHCMIRVKAEQFKKQNEVNPGRLLTKWPNGEINYGPYPVPANEVRPDDVVLCVQYEQCCFDNPAGLKYTDRGYAGWTPQAQSLFFSRCSPETQMSFIEEEHEAALLENSARDASGTNDAKDVS